jgi:DNA polymerase-3 subunit epsilon
MSNLRDNTLINALLWPFAHLPNDYVVLDTETTGIFDEEGAPGILSIGIVRVKNRIIDSTTEFKIKPHRPVLEGAYKIHGISNDAAQSHPDFSEQWETIRKQLNEQLMIMHNAAFDWPLLVDHIHRYKVEPPLISGIFCSQRSAQPWASTMGLKCSERGPSLDTLTETLDIENLRARHDGLHGADIDAKQTALVVNALHIKCLNSQLSEHSAQ